MYRKDDRREGPGTWPPKVQGPAGGLPPLHGASPLRRDLPFPPLAIDGRPDGRVPRTQLPERAVRRSADGDERRDGGGAEGIALVVEERGEGRHGWRGFRADRLQGLGRAEADLRVPMPEEPREGGDRELRRGADAPERSETGAYHRGVAVAEARRQDGDGGLRLAPHL